MFSSFFGFYLYSDFALAFLRIVLGILLLAHGWPKLKALKTTAANFDGMGFKPGAFWGPLVAIAEFFGGLALVLGAETEFVAAAVAIEFLVITIWKITRRQPFVGGFELDILILAAAFLILTQGAGGFSLYGQFLPSSFL